MKDKLSEATKNILCGLNSPLGDIAEKLAGRAVVCWCCSFWRGFMWGIIFTGVLTGVINMVV